MGSKWKIKTLNKVTYKQGKEKAIFDAVWQYVVDHAEIDYNGVYFCKFHTNGKETFARRINKRMKGLYRIDVSEADEYAKFRREQHLKSIKNGMKKKKVKPQVAPNVAELQRNHKTTITRHQSWLDKVKSLWK